MSAQFVNIDRNTPMLLPPDLRDWVDKDDIVHLVLDVCARGSSAEALVNHRGSGSAQYPPSMMLALLLYCYSQGIFSSRKIERATYSHVAVRYITANHHPDHDTIAFFRQRNRAFIRQALVTTVQIAKELGFSQLGTMAIDGTTLKANAGKKTTRSIGELREEIERLCSETVDRADLADEAERAEPPSPRPSKKQIEEAIAKAEAAHKMAKSQCEQLTRKVKECGIGTPPIPPPSALPDSKKVNLVDSDSQLMPMKEGYFAMGYNAQLAVDMDATIITAAVIADNPADTNQLQEVAAQSQANCSGSVHTVVADSGYDNNFQIYELATEQRIHAVVAVKDPLRISTRHLQNRQRQRTRSQKLKRIDELSTPHARALIARRRCTVEPVFGTIKQAMRFRDFRLRGRDNVANEWSLVGAAFNVKRLQALLG